MPLFILLFLLLLLVPDLYVWANYLRGTVPPVVRLLYWLPTATLFAALGIWAAGCHDGLLLRLTVILLMAVALPKLLFTLLSLAGRAIGRLAPAAAAVGNTAGLVAALLLAAACLYGLTHGWKRLVVRETPIRFEHLPPAFDGYRIVHISDLHVGTYGNDTRFIERLAATVGECRPDLVLFTGDLVNSTSEELDPHMEALSAITAPDGVYAVLGNHDYCLYRRYDTPDGPTRNLAALKRKEADMGWRLLLDEHRILRRGADSIALAGVENVSQPPFPSKGDLRETLAGCPDSLFTILMSHDPTHWRREALPSGKVDLMLAGHTHAMQLRIGGFSPSAWSFGEWGGLYREGERALYVSTGVGGTAPFRLGAWPAVDLLILHRADGEE